MDHVIEMSTKIDILKRQPCFSKLHNEEIEILASLLIEIFPAEGDTVVTEGDNVDSVYLIVSGKAKVMHVTYKTDNTKEVEQVATLGPNQAIGLNETGFYSISGKRSATVIAETDMVLLSLSVAAFHGFTLAYSHVSQVMREDARRFLGINS